MLIRSIKRENKDYLINDELIVDENTLIRFNLYVGKNIENIEQIKESIKYELELKKAMEYLKKPKTEYEIEKILTCYQKEIITKLKESYLINDEMYAYNYKNRMEGKRIGKNNIIKDLRNVRISEEIIDNLDFDREIENINYHISHQTINKSNRALKENLKMKLLQRGFELNDINYCLKDFSVDDSNQIQNDYTKALKKYNNLQENEKKQKIIKYLLQKGYTFDLINSIISL